MELVAKPDAAPGLAERYLKVNHAGEHGAICIYTAQIHIARVTAPALVAELAIAATTAAVEKVVLRHLQQQLIALCASDPPATVAISAIVAEEQLHHDRSEALAKSGWFWPKVIAPVVTASTEFVIWTGMRL